MTVAVVTDSTCDLPPELAQRWGIHLVPCTVNFPDRTYRDGVDLTPDEFYQLLQTSDSIPTTTQPPIGEFLQVYRPLIESNREIVSIHLSAKLSATLNSARQAKSSLGDHLPIDIFDSQLTSMSLGLLALEAARLAEAGATRQDIVEQLQVSREKTQCFCLLDTLEYVRRGGRIGRAAAFLASTLQIKPIITLSEGETRPVARPRTKQKAIDKLAELVEEMAPLKALCVLDSTCPHDAEYLRQRLQPTTQGDVISARFGTAMGTHVGPGALGVAMTRA